MTPSFAARWPEVEALLDVLFEQPPGMRQRWLDQHCQDEELRRIVRELLASTDSPGAVALEAGATAAHEWLSARADALPEIPGYRVLGLIGEGGMASVFLAERQLGATLQRVALKRLRLSIYDRDERRRFEHEHRVLARLEHPNIARLLDAGIAPDGVPWFAMEYIEGAPLVAWCDARKLGTDARLALFASVCSAVQHAHQQLVVHRDLKPSNILVDGDGNVKLLDFGIARLLDPDTAPGDGTRTEMRRLTPGYAAPEQYEGQASTATDIYGLGTVLVELLSGRKPATSPGSDPLREMTATPEAAEARSSSLKSLTRLLKGDLRAIARKATRSEPELRYGSAQALADDLLALRTGHPVAARRGDWRYRARCFIRRNKTAVAAATVVVATLVVTTAISVYQAREARAQAARAREVQGFLERTLTPLRTGMATKDIPRLDEVMARGARDLETGQGRDPVAYSELLTLFATTYDRMDDSKTALELTTRLHAHNARIFGPEDPRTLRVLALRNRLQATEHGDTVRFRADVETMLARMQRNGVTGVALAEVLDDLASLNASAGHKREAIEQYTRALAERQRELPPSHPDLATSYANIGNAQFAFAPPRVSLGWYQKAYRHVVRHVGPETRDAGYFLGRIAAAKYYAGDLNEAARDDVAALAIFDRLGLQNHPARLLPLIGTCDDQLDHVQTEPAACKAAADAIRRLETENKAVYNHTSRFLVLILAAQGRLQEAHAVASRVRASLGSQPGEIPAEKLDVFNLHYSEVELIEGDYAAARDHLSAALRTNNGAYPMLIPVWTARLALACEHAPGPACPTDLHARLEALLAAPEFRTHPRRIQAELPLVQLALDQGDIAQAHAYLDDIEAVAALPHLRFPATHRRLVEARMLRGDAFAAQGNREAAMREWKFAEAVFASRYAADHPHRRHLAERLRQTQIASR